MNEIAKRDADLQSPELAHIQASGQENVGGIVPLGKALVLLQRTGIDVIRQEGLALFEKALRGLARIPGLTVDGLSHDSYRFAYKGAVIVFRMEGLTANR